MRPRALGGLVHQRQRLAARPHGPVVVAREPCGGRGFGEQLDPVGSAAVVRQAGEERQRALELRQRLLEGEDLHGGASCRDRRLEGGRRVMRRMAVMGELGGIELRIEALERVRELAVQGDSLAGQRVGVHGLAHQRVPEPVRLARLIGGHHVVTRRVAQRAGELVIGQAARRAEHLVRHGGRPPRAPGRGRSPSPRAAPPVPAAPHSGSRGRFGGAGQPRRGELARVERVAVGSPVDLLHELLRGALAAQRFELERELRPRQRPDPELVDVGAPSQIGENRSQRVVPGELVGPVGHRQRDPLAAQVTDRKGQEVTRGAVGPVRILHDAERARFPGHQIEEVEELLEEAALCELARIVCGGVPGRERGHQPRQRGPELTGRVLDQLGGGAAHGCPSSMATIGAYGSSPSPSGTQSPQRTVMPRSPARAAATRTSRVFPKPASRR